MNILFFAAHDFAGVIWQLYNAINKYTEHEARMIRVYPHIYEYPTQYEYHKLTSIEVSELFGWADVWHFNEMYSPPVREDDMKGKKILTHCHGFAFRSNMDCRKKLELSLERNWFNKVLLSTPDLYKFIIPQTDSTLYQYLPNPFPIDDLLYQPVERSKDLILVDHSPFNPAMKGTGYLVDAVGNLALKGYKVKLQLNMNVPHKECLKIKQKCHITFDSIATETATHDLEAVGLGVNGIESLAQGKPVLVRITHGMKYYEELTKGAGLTSVPLVLVEKGTLECKLEELLKSPEKIDIIGKAGRTWVEKTHSAEIISKKLIKIYEELPVH